MSNCFGIDVHYNPPPQLPVNCVLFALMLPITHYHCLKIAPMAMDHYGKNSSPVSNRAMYSAVHFGIVQ